MMQNNAAVHMDDAAVHMDDAVVRMDNTALYGWTFLNFDELSQLEVIF